jgi:tape measure domain-containing protein
MEGGDQDLVAIIDDKVVAMSFESSRFESGVNKTIAALDKLKASLQFKDMGKGFNDINKAVKTIQLGHIAQAVDAIKEKLNALRLTAIAVFAQIAQKAIAMGTKMVKALTLDPIQQGYSEYITKINAIQTILANTQAAGTNLQDVSKALKQLNDYSDKTIYNFGQMARNIGTFTAAGVDLDTSVAAIKGIANLAALSGSSAEQAATAMYQLSQALASGRVAMIDWISVRNAGMGGAVFQRMLAQTAEAMGTLKKGAVELSGPMKNVRVNGEAFAQSLSVAGKEPWLTSKVLTATLRQFTGDLKDAELAAMGFSGQQIRDIQKTAKTARLAATEVKDFFNVLKVAGETAGSGWSETFEIVLGTFPQAKKSFTELSNTINNFINANADARNKVLSDWKKLGGRRVLIDAIRTAFHNLVAVVRPIKQAFRDIFPAKTGKDLFALTVRFKEFTETLKPSPETIENLRRTFRGLFALLSIGKQIIGGIFTVFRKVFGALGDGSGSFLEITGTIGDFIVKIDKALKKGDSLNKFFSSLGDVIAEPFKLLSGFINLIADFSPGGFSDQLVLMIDTLLPLSKILEVTKAAWEGFIDSLGGSDQIFQSIGEGISRGLQAMGPAIANAVSGINFEAILSVIRTGLFAALVVMFKQFLGRGSLLEQLSGGFGQGILGNISGTFSALEGSMKSLQTNIKAKTLKEIAIAVALLVASIVALSFIDPKKLNSAMSALTLVFGQLLGAMYILEKISQTTGFIKMPIIGAALIALAIAINILTVAVFALSRLSWEQLAKGLGAVVVLLGAISAASIPLSRNSAGLIKASIGITGIAIALNLLAIAVKIFATMSWEELAKGLGSVAAALGIIAGVAKVMPTKGLIVTGAGLIVIATALNILALAIKQLGSMDVLTLAKGLGAIAASLVIIAGAMRIMPKGMVAQAAALVLVSVALNGIALALKTMGGMSPEQVATGLAALGGALAILATGMKLMAGSFAGAAALGAAAAGLALLAPTLVLMGRQKWSTIVKGLTALGIAVGILVLAARLLPAAVPALMSFGVALLLIGGGLALAGAGIALIGAGLSAIAVAGPTALAILTTAFWEFVKSIQENGKLLVLGLLEIVQAFAETAPKFVDALVKIIESLLEAIIQIAPKLVPVITALITTMIEVLRINQDAVIQAGIDLIIALLLGIRKNLPQVLKLAADIIVSFLNGLAKHIGRIVSAGINLMTVFIRAIASNLGKVIKAGADIIINIVKGIGNNARRLVTAAAQAIASFVQGIASAGQTLINAGVAAAGKLINGIVDGILKLVDIGARAIIKFLNGIADAIEKYEPQMIAAGIRIGVAIVTGMVRGLAQAGQNFLNKVGDLAGKAEGMAKKALGIFNPSRVFMDIGAAIVEGMTIGISDDKDATKAAADMSNNVIDMFKSIFQITSPSKVMIQIGRFVGAGFAQGLKGSTDEIKGAFAELNRQLTQAMKDANKTITTEQANLKKLRAEEKPNTKAIKAAEKAIKDATFTLNRSTAAHKALQTQMKKHRTELLGLAKDYDKLITQLDAAKTVFQEFKDIFSELPEIITEVDGRQISGADQVQNWIKDITGDVKDLTEFGNVIKQLRLAGVSDAVIEMILRKGPAALPFAKALLEGGPELIATVNNLQSQIETAATNLGNEAGEALYDAGEKAMDGFINGLTNKIKDLQGKVKLIVDGIVRVVRRRLRIDSPSKVFAEIGQLTMDGMAKGIIDSSSVVTDAVETVANDATEAIRTTLGEIPFDDLIDTEPVITPVLDLTALQAGAAQMKGMIPTTPAVGVVSSEQAAVISRDQAVALSEEPSVALGGTSFNFEQNNYSPKALTDIEIYRQTRNQLSQIKSALATT